MRLLSPRARVSVGLAALAVAGIPALSGSAGATAGRPKAKPPAFRAGIRPFPAAIVTGKSIVVDPRGTRFPRGDQLVSHTISFGDGKKVKTSGPLTPVRHTYGRPGSYTITLTVTDRHHATVRTTRKLRVTARAIKGPVVAVTPVVPTAAPAPTPTPTSSSAPAPTPVKPTPTQSPAAQTGPLAGSVRHAGAAVSGVLVVAAPYLDPTSGSSAPEPDARPELRTTTATDGTFAFPRAMPGKYEVYVDGDPDSGSIPDDTIAATAVTVTVADGGTAIYNAVVDDPVTVVGTLSGPAGGIPGTVSGSTVIGRATFTVTTMAGSDGTYRLHGLPASASPFLDYLPTDTLLSEESEYPDYSSKAGQTLTQNQVVVAAGAVSGKVVYSTGAVAKPIQFSYSGQDASGNYLASGFGATAADGTIALGHLKPGTYTVTANDPDYPNTDPAYSSATSGSLTVTAGKTVAAGTLTLSPSNTITGTVSEVGSPPADGFVYIDLGNGGEVGTSTDAMGGYSIAGLPDGTYTVNAVDESSGDTGMLPGVMVSGGQTLSGENVQLIPGSGAIAP